MKNIIGYLKNLNGSFFAKDTDDNLREIHAGDPIYAGEIIVDENGQIIHDALRRVDEETFDHINSDTDTNANLTNDTLLPDDKKDHLPSEKHSSTSTDSFDNASAEANINSALRHADFFSENRGLVREYGEYDVNAPLRDSVFFEDEVVDDGIGGVAATGTIEDVDTDVTISISDTQTTISEEAGESDTFTISLSEAMTAGNTVTVDVDFVTGSDTENEDFTAAALAQLQTAADATIGVSFDGTTLTFSDTFVGTDLDFTVTAADDALLDSPETLNVTLGNATAVNGTATANDSEDVTITDTDVNTTVTSITSETELEGDNLTHTVTLNQVAPVTTTFAFSIGGGDASEGIDYDGTPLVFSAGVTDNGDGTITIDPGVSSFTVTVGGLEDTTAESDETYDLIIDGVTGVGTIQDNDTPVSPVITAVVTTTRVSEEGLTDGIADDVGTSGSSPDVTDTTDAVVDTTGSFTVMDVNISDTVTISLVAPAVGAYTSNSEDISWVVSNGGLTIVGSATIDSVVTDIMRIDISDAGSGNYTYSSTLLGPIDHAVPASGSVENELIVNIDIVASDGTGTLDATETLHVVVEDDSPIAASGDNIVELHIAPITTNLSFIVDISSSMSDQDLIDTQAAIQAAVDAYADMGSVNVNIVQFYGGGTIESGWITAAEANALVLDNTRSGTDIEQGLRAIVENSYGVDQPAAATQDIMYFFGDGPTYDGYQTDFNAYTGITDPNINPWTDFVTSGQIDALLTYSVNTTTMVGDVAHVADNGEDVISQPAVNLTDIAGLVTEITNSVQLYQDGDLTQDIATGTPLIEFGADGGYLASVTIGTYTVTYDENNPTQTVTGTHGDFEINFETGTYRYTPTDTNRVDSVEQIGAVIRDNDGDEIDTILLNINISFDTSLSNAPSITEGDTSVVVDIAQVIGTALDLDGTIDSNTITATNGVAVLEVNGDITYTPNANYTGSDIVSVSVTDNDGLTSIRNITISVDHISVESVSTETEPEGTALIHVVTINGATNSITDFAFDLVDGTALDGSDYDSTALVFSDGVTLNGAGDTVTVPVGVSIFTVTVPTVQDDTSETGESEDYAITVGSVTGTGNIRDDDAMAPSLTMTIDGGTHITQNIVITDDFQNGDVIGWSNAKIDGDEMTLDGKKASSNTSTFDFGPSNDGETVSLTFETEISNKWETSDTIQLIINGITHTFANTGGTALDTASNDNDNGAVTQSLTGLILDSSGILNIDILNSRNDNKEDAWFDNFIVTLPVSEYKYEVDLTATLTDSDETLSDLILTDIPAGVTRIEDGSGTVLSYTVGSGTYTFPTTPTSGALTTVYFVSESSTLDTTGVHVSVTSTEVGGDNSVITVDSAGTAQIVDGIIEGLYYETTSGLSGTTDADGYFDYLDDDVVTFKLGNVALGRIDTAAIEDGKVFLQDIANVDRTDMNDEYVENMAVLLQSLDSDTGDNIMISEEMHEAFLDENFDLATISEEELIAIIEANGATAVSEEDAMVHVGEMLETYNGVEEGTLDTHIDDTLDEGIYILGEEQNIDLSVFAVEGEVYGTTELTVNEDHTFTNLTLSDVLDVSHSEGMLTTEMDESEDIWAQIDQSNSSENSDGLMGTVDGSGMSSMDKIKEGTLERITVREEKDVSSDFSANDPTVMVSVEEDIVTVA